VGNHFEKLEALEESEKAEDLEDIVAYDKFALKPTLFNIWIPIPDWLG